MPRVYQIRCLSSVALASAPKLMLEASCSAADAMRQAPLMRSAAYMVSAARPLQVPDPEGVEHLQAFASSFFGLGVFTMTEPPSFSTAAIADLEAPATSM